MSRSASADGAAAPRAPQRLTLEEKVWMDRRKNDIQQCSAFGGGLGMAVGGALTAIGPFPKRVQAATILGGLIIGGGVGFLYADSMAIKRIEDLSASSRLRKDYQQLELEKKASKADK